MLFTGSAAACAVPSPMASMATAAAPIGGTLRSEIDALLDEASSSYGTMGHSVAILRRGALVYARHAGLADREAGIPISDRSAYPIFSISKLFLIVEMLSAADRGEIDLDISISRIRPGLPATWGAITLRQALAHASGLPDYVPDHIAATADGAFDAIRAMPLRFPPGSGNDYNQTNFLLAREGLERATGRELTLLTAAQFERAGMTRTRYRVGEAPIDGLVRSYRPAPDRRLPALLYEVPAWPTYTFGSSGAVATLRDLVGWSQALLRGDLLPLGALLRSWQPFRLTSGELAWHTNGWNRAAHDGIVSVGHAGSNRLVWRHSFRADDPTDSATIVYLDNGGRNPLMPARVASLLADRVMPGAARPHERLEEALFQRLASDRWGEAEAAIAREDSTLGPVAVEAAINRVGYDALSMLGVEAALPPFRLNVTRFPTSANAHDSLGEAYRATGNLAASRASYARALELDPGNLRIAATLREIDALNRARP